VTNAAQPVSDAVSRTYNDSFLTALPIVTYAPSGDPVVEIGGPLLAPMVNLPAPSGPAPCSRLGARCRLSEGQSFPDNVLIDAESPWPAHRRGTSVGLSYSFGGCRRWGRSAAHRGRARGYFTTVRQDWMTKYTEKENIIRYINRWDVKKKDPSLELSPPDKPIVFVIERRCRCSGGKYVAKALPNGTRLMRSSASSARSWSQPDGRHEFATSIRRIRVTTSSGGS